MRALTWAVLPLPAPGVAGDLHLLVSKRGGAGLPNSGVFLRDSGWGVGVMGWNLTSRWTYEASSPASLIWLLSSVS